MTKRLLLYSSIGSAFLLALALRGQTLPPPSTPGIFSLEVDSLDLRWNSQHDYEPPGQRANYSVFGEVLGVTSPGGPAGSTVAAGYTVTPIPGASGNTTTTFVFDPNYGARKPETVRTIRSIPVITSLPAPKYSKIVLKSSWDGNGLVTSKIEAKEYLSGTISSISLKPGYEGAALMENDTLHLWPWHVLVPHDVVLETAGAQIGYYYTAFKYRFIQGSHYYFSVLQADGTRAVFHRDYYDIATEDGVQYPDFVTFKPIGELKIEGTPGHGPGSEYVPQTRIRTTDEIQSNLKRDLNAARFTEDSYPLLDQAVAKYSEAPDPSASKMRYKLGFQAGIARTITWAETFTPEGAGQPSDYNFLSETVTADAAKTKAYIIDPFEPGNPHRFGSLPGKYEILMFEASLAADTNGDGQILPVTHPITPYRIANVDQTALGGDFQFKPNFNDDSDSDSPQPAGPDCLNNVVDGQDDLKDFLPVYLKLGELLKVMPPANGFSYKLTQEDSALNMVFTNLTQAKAFDYRDPNKNSVGYGPEFGDAASRALTHWITNTGFGLFDPNPSSGGSLRFMDVCLNNGGGVILIEARKGSNKPLVLRIEKSGKVVAEIQLALSIFDLQLAVDADRNGTIKLAGENASDATSAEKPYRFWLNDDFDRSHTVDGNETEEDDLGGNEVIGKKVDSAEGTITSKRDLEDYSRLWISTQGLNDAFKDENNPLYLGLQWADTGDTTPAVRVFKHVETDGGTEYLGDDATAGLQSNLQLQSRVAWAIEGLTNTSAEGLTMVDASDKNGRFFVFPKSLFSSLTESTSNTCLLFEGVQAGKGQLRLIILKKENETYTKIGDGPGVWMDLQSPYKFVQRWTCGDGDLAPVTNCTLSASQSGIFAAPTADEEKDLILYVHGYNMQEFEKQRWIEATYKRLYWLGYKGRVGGFTWPCTQRPLPFDESEERAWQSGTQLNALLLSLKSQGYRVHLLGHSQGNVVIGEALRQAGPNSALVSTYVASQAAIAAHCYDASLPERDGETAFTPETPNVYARYWTLYQDTYRPETWGANSPSYLAATYVQGSAGRFVNFYNPQDWALTGNGINPLGLNGTQTGWLSDQRLKPNNGYDYASYIGFRESPLTNFDPRRFGFPDDRFTIFSFCAEARSSALGATSTGGVFANSEVNLSAAPRNFGNRHIYHSGQFRSSYAQRWQYWQRLMDSCDLNPRQKP